MPTRFLILPALLPAILTAVAIVISIFQQRALLMGRVDALVLFAIVAYLSVVAILATRRAALARLCLLAYSCAFALLCLEVATRWMGDSGAIRPAPWPKLQLIGKASNSMPGIEGEIRFTTNSLGLRGPELSPTALQEIDLKVLCVGGSTTECLYVADKSSWPWRLGTLLQEETGEGVYVGNAGRSGQMTLNHLYLLRNYPLASQFDWVVMLCGMNDAGALFRGNYEERAGRVAQDTLVGDRAAAIGPFYRRLMLVEWAQASWARAVNSTPAITQDPTGAWYDTIRQKRREALALRPLTELPPELEAAQTRYRETLHRIIELCRSREQQIVFLTQPTLYQKEMSKELQSLLWQHRDDGAYTPEVLEQMLAAFNESLVAVCQQEKVPCIDLAAALPKDTTVFYDDCHFNTSGSLRVADLVAEFFVQQAQQARDD